MQPAHARVRFSAAKPEAMQPNGRPSRERASRTRTSAGHAEGTSRIRAQPANRRGPATNRHWEAPPHGSRAMRRPKGVGFAAKRPVLRSRTRRMRSPSERRASPRGRSASAADRARRRSEPRCRAHRPGSKPSGGRVALRDRGGSPKPSRAHRSPLADSPLASRSRGCSVPRRRSGARAGRRRCSERPRRLNVNVNRRPRRPRRASRPVAPVRMPPPSGRPRASVSSSPNALAVKHRRRRSSASPRSASRAVATNASR